jgi:hypothetical protein
MRSATNGLRDAYGTVLPSAAALDKGRERLGSKPFELLFDRCRGPLATAGMPSAFAFGRRLAAWDGTTLDEASGAGNAAAFGVPRGGRRPQLRLLALTECGTRACIDAAFDGCAAVSEHALTRRLLHALEPGMLLLADRNFRGHAPDEPAATTPGHRQAHQTSGPRRYRTPSGKPGCGSAALRGGRRTVRPVPSAPSAIPGRSSVAGTSPSRSDSC